MVNTITCSNVSKAYEGNGITTHAVQDINLTFQKGEFIAVVGPSGSGKSTLLNLIGTLDQPTSGDIFYDGKQLSNRKKTEMADFRFEHIGFVFQQFHLLPTLTALENTMTPLFTRKVSYNKTVRAKEVLKQVGLEDKHSSLPSQLSGGQQQRVAIARALIHEPDWILADEPTGNLDTNTGGTIIHLLQSMNKEKGCGVIIVTHDLTYMEKADRVINLQDGNVMNDTSYC